MELIAAAGTLDAAVDGEAAYVEHVRSRDLRVGTYVIPVGAEDPQRPHTEDEIYIVTAGRATLVTPTASVDVGPGAVVLVPALEPHHFDRVTEDLVLIVVFGR